MLALSWSPRPLSRADVALTTLWLVVNLHLLRNVSSVGYALLVVGSCLTVGILAASPVAIAVSRRRALWLNLYLLSIVPPTVITAMDHGAGVTAFALVRQLFPVPIVLAAVGLVRSWSQAHRLLLFGSAFVTLGLATIPLQYVTGPISWFAEPGFRAGTVRYASLLGSLPASGAGAVLATLCVTVLAIRPAWKAIWLCGLVTLSLLTFQKLALVGVPVAVALGVALTDRRQLARLLVAFALAGVLAAGAYASRSVLPDDSPVSNAIDYAIESIRPGEQGIRVTADVGVLEGAIERLGEMPRQSLQELVDLRGWQGWFVGGGFAMVGAALVPPETTELVTSHNGYIDLVRVGGLPHLAAFLGLLLSCCSRAQRARRLARRWRVQRDVPSAMLGIGLLAGLMTLFAGGTLFQPAVASFVWLALGLAIKGVAPPPNPSLVR